MPRAKSYENDVEVLQDDYERYLFHNGNEHSFFSAFCLNFSLLITSRYSVTVKTSQMQVQAFTVDTNVTSYMNNAYWVPIYELLCMLLVDICRYFG